MANISNVVNVALIPEGQLAARDNMNVVMLITSEQGDVLDSNNRYRLYSDGASVAADFGTNSKTNDFATAFFGTQPNPTNVGGVLVVGYWRAAEETVEASAAKLTGAQISEAATLPILQQISDGNLEIDINGTTETLNALDFRTATNLDDAVAIIDTALTGATATLENQRIIITSDTTGATSTITFATDSGTGTFIGNTLALAEGTGALTTQGAAADTLAAETKLEAITELKSNVNFKGAVFIDNPTDIESKDLAEWANANSVLVYDVFSGADYLEIATDNVVWDIKLSSLDHYRMLYSKANNRKLAVSYMARAHTVNFNGENTALTMNLKELSVAAEEYTQSEITAAYNVGLDIYTTIKNTPVVLTSPANDFTDNVYNIIAFVDAIQTDTFNLLKQTGTKTPQTKKGVNRLIDQAEKTTRGFVRAGVFAPGTWSSPDYFGNRETFEQNILNNGFYFLAGSLADQPQVDRQNRLSPVLRGAVKNAGAIHKADIIINFNK
jgi:hypothetical protein